MSPELEAVAHTRAAPTGRIGAILFADVVGFSRLTTDARVLEFFATFLDTVARLLERGTLRPLVRNTWGDGLYLVFADMRSAGIFALDLCRCVRQTSWRERDLPEDLSIRVALHGGPLHAFVDPVTRQPTLSGRHVTRAARMEPVTPPGLVFASREFAALAAAEDVPEFRCEPVGRVQLDKRAGLMPLFVVRPCVPELVGDDCPPVPTSVRRG